MTAIAAQTWERLPGLAHEVSLGADGSAWCLGMGEMPGGGYSIHRWNGTDWDHVAGAAVKIAVGQEGQPWVINRANQILRATPEGWDLLPGLASEIAAGADGSVWCLSSAKSGSGESTIHVWNGRDWDHVDGAAVKIAAGPPGSTWIVQSDHAIYRAA